MTRTNNRILKHRAGLLNLAEELGKYPWSVKSWASNGIRFIAIKRAIVKAGV